jgi:hypothetical protein
LEPELGLTGQEGIEEEADQGVEGSDDGGDHRDPVGRLKRSRPRPRDECRLLEREIGVFRTGGRIRRWRFGYRIAAVGHLGEHG